jgi:NADH dehydrogenase (ubiquinone) 1 alpha subcomplex subunit 5
MLKLFKSSLKRFSQSSLTTSSSLKFDHYNPDLENYRDLDEAIKHSTGYAALEVEPFPRYKIMKLCLLLLQKLQKELPEDFLYRTYSEEKFKYIMELTHENKNISDLEDLLGYDQIEFFIENLAREFYLIEILRNERPWEKSQQSEENRDLEFQLDAMTKEEFSQFKVNTTESEKILIKNLKD